MEIYRNGNGKCFTVNLKNVAYVEYYQKEKILRLYYNFIKFNNGSFSSHFQKRQSGAYTVGDENVGDFHINCEQAYTEIDNIELKEYIAIVAKIDEMGG